LKPKGLRRSGEDWHGVSEEYAELVIALNQSSTCEITQNMVLEMKGKLSKGEVIYVPYNHPLLRLDHNKMVCLGSRVNKLRSKYYANTATITRKKINDARRVCGCKQLCTLVT
jgi:hypothetical protein